MDVFTRNEKSGKITKRKYPTTDTIPYAHSNLSQKNLSGYSNLSVRESQKKQNNTSVFSVANYAKKLLSDTTKSGKQIKSEDITEKLEKERIYKATKQNLQDVPVDKLNSIYKLKEKRNDDYYNLTKNSGEDHRRMKELFGPRVYFSISNVENNYDMLNKDEKTMLTSNAQRYFNTLGYTDKNGKRLKEDGVWGPKTQGVYDAYKRNSGYNLKKDESVTGGFSRKKTEDKELNEYIYDLQNMVATPENIRSDVSLYGKSQLEESTKIAYDKDGLKLKENTRADFLKNYLHTEKKDNQHDTVANQEISKAANNLYSFVSRYMNHRENIDYKKYREILDMCKNDTEIRKDYFQYGVMKVLRSINNIFDKGELYKYKSVINYVGSMLKETLYYKERGDIRYCLEEAIKVTTDKNLISEPEKVIALWMKLYAKSCEGKNHKKAFLFDNPRMLSADYMDYGINYIINAVNSGKYDGTVYLHNNIKNVPEKIYNDVTKKYIITNDGGSAYSSGKENTYNSY